MHKYSPSWPAFHCDVPRPLRRSLDEPGEALAGWGLRGRARVRAVETWMARLVGWGRLGSWDTGPSPIVFVPIVSRVLVWEFVSGVETGRRCDCHG